MTFLLSNNKKNPRTPVFIAESRESTLPKMKTLSKEGWIILELCDNADTAFIST